MTISPQAEVQIEPGVQVAAPANAAAAAADATAVNAAAVSPAPEIAGLATSIEALIVSASRPLQPVRIAQALGLVAPDELPGSDANGAPGSVVDPAAIDATASVEPAVIVVKKPRRKKASGPTPPDPLELVRLAVAHLNAVYAESDRSFRIELVAGGYRLMTLPRHAGVVAALHGLGTQSKLSRPAIETLAIIAYRQPVTKGHLEAIRGVSCGEVLKTLLERRLITIAGRAEELGRPLLYATTRQFLQSFGLASLKDLPTTGELGLKQG